MYPNVTNARMTARLVDSLYVEAMVLADEARAYFDQIGRAEREAPAAARPCQLLVRIAQGHDAADACHRLAAHAARKSKPGS